MKVNDKIALVSLKYILPTWDTNFKMESDLHKFKLIVDEVINPELFHGGLQGKHNGGGLITFVYFSLFNLLDI